MPNLQDLLARGYFPKELPPPFTTVSFASHVCTAPRVADFAKTIDQKPKSSKAGRYSLARGGLLRRPLSICNPVAYFLLCQEIVSSWTEISPFVVGTVISSTHPEEKATGRAVDGHFPQSARSEQARQKRLGKRYVLQTDVSRYYSSIYTHSIPWAMHSKATAKVNRSFSLVGNRLDALVRLGQDQQTIGIPIGPDTSLVIAEILMQRCDEHLASQFPSIQGFRFIDDFELSFMTQAEAERAHHELEACLSEYELAINPKKTSIRDLPIPLEAPWATQLKRAKPRKEKNTQAADLAHLFDLAFKLHRENPEDAVLQFAISLLQFETIHPENWSLFQKLLMLCSFPEPACFPGAIRQIVLRKNLGMANLIPEIAEITNALVVTHSPLRHSSEVANAVYACIALGMTLGDAAVDAVSRCDDPVVALLALDCESRNLTTKKVDKTLWKSHMKAAALYDEYWLLAYEANIRNWLPNNRGKDFVAADPNFSSLKAAGVHFYDTTINLPVAQAVTSPVTPQASNGDDGTAQLTVAVPPVEPAIPTDAAFSV